MKCKCPKFKRIRGGIEVIKDVTLPFRKRVNFFGRNSGIHGLKQIFDENTFLLSRLFWIVIVLISSGFLYLILVPAVEMGDQVNFTPDTRYLQWVSTFPAVTVCEAYNSKTALKNFMRLNPDLIERLAPDFKKYLTEITYGRGSCGRAVCIPCGTLVPCDVKWREIIEKLRKKCTEMITDCDFNGEKFDCCKKFLLVDSESGYCFAFNTLQNKNSRKFPLYTVNRTTGPGMLTFRVLNDVQVTVHSPEELATNVLDAKFRFDVKVQGYNRMNFLFSMVEMENDPILLTEDIEVRGCRQLEEIPDGAMHNYPVYSYGACRLAEDTEHLFEHCGCIHPVRDISYQEHYCNYTGVNCLIVTNVQKQKLGVETHEHEEDCLPSCVESELSTIHISKRWVPEEKEGALVTVEMASLPTLRYIRSLVRTDLDTVVSIGGMVSLFFAASILSIFEIFYLLFRSQK